MIKPSRFARSATMAVAVACAGALIGSVPAAAQPAKSAAELEALFWRCDYETTQGLLDIGSAEACSNATESLRAIRFQGDFNTMLEWWQQNKDSQHRALRLAAAQAKPAVTTEERIRGMTDADLKRLYLRCAQASEQRRLSTDEITACSVGQDTLLSRVFAGRFEALLAWSNTELISNIDVAQRTDVEPAQAPR